MIIEQDVRGVSESMSLSLVVTTNHSDLRPVVDLGPQVPDQHVVKSGGEKDVGRVKGQRGCHQHAEDGRAHDEIGRQVDAGNTIWSRHVAKDTGIVLLT